MFTVFVFAIYYFSCFSFSSQPISSLVRVPYSNVSKALAIFSVLLLDSMAMSPKTYMSSWKVLPPPRPPTFPRWRAVQYLILSAVSFFTKSAGDYQFPLSHPRALASYPASITQHLEQKKQLRGEQLPKEGKVLPRWTKGPTLRHMFAVADSATLGFSESKTMLQSHGSNITDL